MTSKFNQRFSGRRLLPFSHILLIGGCVLKLPFPGMVSPVSNWQFYPGTLLIIAGSVVTEIAVFDMLVSTKPGVGVGLVVAARLTEVGSSIGRVIANTGVGLLANTSS